MGSIWCKTLGVTEDRSTALRIFAQLGALPDEISRTYDQLPIDESTTARHLESVRCVSQALSYQHYDFPFSEFRSRVQQSDINCLESASLTLNMHLSDEVPPDDDLVEMSNTVAELREQILGSRLSPLSKQRMIVGLNELQRAIDEVRLTGPDKICRAAAALIVEDLLEDPEGDCSLREKLGSMVRKTRRVTHETAATIQSGLVIMRAAPAVKLLAEKTLDTT